MDGMVRNGKVLERFPNPGVVSGPLLIACLRVLLHVGVWCARLLAVVMCACLGGKPNTSIASLGGWGSADVCGVGASLLASVLDGWYWGVLSLVIVCCFSTCS